MKNLEPATESGWGRLTEEWERSGLSQKKFCERKGLSYWAFCKQRSRRRRKRDSETRAEKPSFLPVSIETEVPDSPTRVRQAVLQELEVELPFGVVLRFKGLSRP